MREEFGTYRGKSREDNAWVYGYFFNNANQSLIFPKSNLPVEYLDTVPVYLETVGRRLAWNDDKGNPLYQGDIVSVNDRYIAIVVNDYSLVLNGKLRQAPYTDWWMVYKGNVFDNPEYLPDFDLLFAVIVWCDVSLYLWFGNNRTHRTIRGNWQNATYPWVDLAYKLWIFLHVVLIGGFFIVCWFVL